MKKAEEKAIKLKAIFYSKKFVEKYGDWLSAGKEYMNLQKSEQTPERKTEILKNHNVTIDIDDGFEPVLTEELLQFVFSEYERIFNGPGELEL